MCVYYYYYYKVFIIIKWADTVLFISRVAGNNTVMKGFKYNINQMKLNSSKVQHLPYE